VVLGLFPLQAQLEQLVFQQQRLEQQTVKKKKRAAHLSEWVSLENSLQARWRAFNDRLLPESDSAGVIESLGSHSLQARIDLNDIEWLPEKQDTDYVVIPLHLKLSGHYPNIRHFFRLLAQDEYLITVEEVSIARAGKDSERLSVSVWLAMYRSVQGRHLESLDE
jgi:Tfp pilus assembly protein PilO